MLILYWVSMEMSMECHGSIDQGCWSRVSFDTQLWMSLDLDHDLHHGQDLDHNPQNLAAMHDWLGASTFIYKTHHDMNLHSLTKVK